VIIVYLQMSSFSAISWWEQVTFWCDDDVHFVLNQYAELEFNDNLKMEIHAELFQEKNMPLQLFSYELLEGTKM